MLLSFTHLIGQPPLPLTMSHLHRYQVLRHWSRGADCTSAALCAYVGLFICADLQTHKVTEQYTVRLKVALTQLFTMFAALSFFDSTA